MKMVKLFAVMGLALAFSVSASAGTVTAIDVTTATAAGLGLTVIELVATAGGGENNPNAFEVHAAGVEQVYFAGVLPTPDLTNGGFVAPPEIDTHMLFAGSDWVAFNGLDGPQGSGSVFDGDIMSLTPAAVPGSSFSFFTMAFPSAGPASVSGLVAAPGLSVPFAFSFNFPSGPIIPVPAALPLGLAGMGLLTVIRRRFS